MATSRLWAGASGYAFKEWKGSFYPEKIQPESMLAWYAERLPAVEINNTFYQMPKVAVLENWAKSTPADFRFAIKAHQVLTHIKRLKNTEEFLPRFLSTIEPLARAGTAVGVDGIFLEVHDHPERALSDGSNALRLDLLPALLAKLI